MRELDFDQMKDQEDMEIEFKNMLDERSRVH